MKNIFVFFVLSIFALTLPTLVMASPSDNNDGVLVNAFGSGPIGSKSVKADEEVLGKVLITDVNIFDGNGDTLLKSMSVLIEGRKIAKIAKAIPVEDGTYIVQGGGRTLTPGFIGAHEHLQLNVGPLQTMYATHDYLGALALYESKNSLMRGFTTIRDVGGFVFGVKKAIDEGYFPGPRIYASGPAISMSSGHGDYNAPMTRPRLLGGSESEFEILGITTMADGVPEVLAASRMHMRNGAAFLKMFVAGAVSGVYDPLDVAEYSYEEIKAAVDEAGRWNTYVAAHTYTDKSTQMAIKAGVKTLEHCNLISEETVKMAVEKNVYISPQASVYLGTPPPDWTPQQKARQKQAAEGLDTLMKYAKKHKAKIAFGTDLIMDFEAKKSFNDEFTYRTKWFTNAEILKQATSINGEILALSGRRNPYPGKLGVIEEGALADLLLINGNPLEDISILTEPEKNISLIMKDGKIYKNTIE